MIPNKALALLGVLVDVNLKSQDRGEYLEIAVDPYPNPISYKGEFYYRSGSTKQVLRGAALSRFLLQKYGRTWDDVPLPGVGLKDLDGRVFDGFRQRGADSERLPPDILDESDEGVIERLQLREAGFLKRAGVLLFHPAPDRFVMEGSLREDRLFPRRSVVEVPLLRRLPGSRNRPDYLGNHSESWGPVRVADRVTTRVE